MRLQRGALHNSTVSNADWVQKRLMRDQMREPTAEEKIRAAMRDYQKEALDKVMHIKRKRRLNKVVHPSAMVGQKKFIIP